MQACFVIIFKQKTTYEMRMSDWSSDVCSSDLAVRGVARGLGVLLGARPPPADHLVARIADALRLLERGRVHHAPAVQDHIVGLVLPGDLQPDGLLVQARRGDRELLDLEAVR